MKNICVVGVGYVGLVTGTCFADLGNHVIALDINLERIENLKQGLLPIYEPGLEEMVKRNVAAGRLEFTTSYAEALREAEFAFIAVGTPEGVDGEADLQYVRQAAESIAQNMSGPLIIVNKSTVPVGTGDWVAEIVRAKQPQPIAFSVVSCPEFLREGSALSDFMNPARTVLGSLDPEAAHRVADLHLPLRAPIVVVDLRTAEMIKYASNAFLATKISFINEIANICEALGADVKEVATGMGYDPRIGRSFLDAGLGYGGSCFPKDVDAFIRLSEKSRYDFSLLKSVRLINDEQRRWFVRYIEEKLWNIKDKTIGVWGIAFKPNTDDIRNSAAIEIITMLQAEGAKVKAFDPKALENARKELKGVKLCEDAYEAADDCDCLVLLTEWADFKDIDFRQVHASMRQPVVFDGRNFLNPELMESLGFEYYGVGRGK